MSPTAPARQVLGRLLRTAGAPWGRLAFATVLGAAAAACTVGLLAGSGAVVARAALRPGLGAIAGLLASVEVLAFLRGPLRYGERLVGHDAAFHVLARWRVWLYERLEPLSPAGLQAWRSGDVLSRAVEDVDQLQDLYLRSASPLVVAVLVSLLAVVVVGVLVPPAALVVGGALAVGLVAPPLLSLAVRVAQRREASARGQMAADIVELCQGSADLVAFGLAEEALARIEATDRTLTVAARRRAFASGLASALVLACLGAAVVGVLALAVQAAHGHRLAPVMVAVLPLTAIGAFEVVPPVTAAVLRLEEVVQSGRRLLAVAATPPPVRDPENPARLAAGCPTVTVDGARLRYADDLPWALDGLSLRVPPTARAAVVGRSGSGKTSLVHALLRFWPLQQGTAELDGRPLEALRQDDVRTAFGLLDQDAYLFTGTIRDNLALAAPRATDQELARTLRLAHLDGWLASLPDGLDTPVGERGSALSAGQRQRVALARMLMREAPVLLLDEPTAGLDAQMAADLLRDVLAAAASRSVLLVTHRPHDLDAFDNILVMEHGHIVANKTIRRGVQHAENTVEETRRMER